jgi:hypothetical protein
MAVALFMVKATIPLDREAAFNRWYSEEHCPQLLRYPGAVSARRYRQTMGGDGPGPGRAQYLAVYEFQDEPTLERFLDSEHFKELRAEYDRAFGDVSTRERFAFVQVWP